MGLGGECGGVVSMRWRAWQWECFQARGDAGRPDWAARETLSAAWLLPKDQASISLQHLLFLLRCRSLLLLLAPSIALHFLLSFPSCVSPSIPLFISLPSCSSPGPLQTLSGGLRVGGGRLRRWDEEIERDKSPEMRPSAESGWL